MDEDWDETSFVDTDDETDTKKAHLVMLRGALVGQTIRVLEPQMTIGRMSGADLRLDDDGVSRLHCKLTHQHGSIFVEDLGSRNGTYCNGERLAIGARQLVEGDRLQIGTTATLLFTYLDEDAASTDGEDAALATTDPLTGAYTRRHLMNMMAREVTTSLERKSALALLMFHIDRYDEISQQIGPDPSNELVVAVFQRVREQLRDKKDVLARIERGDFMVMARATSPGGTHLLAERIRAAVNKAPFELAGNPQPITISVGVASIQELRITNEQDMFVAASLALHRARRQGGNRVVPCTQDLQERNRRSAV